MAPLIILCIDSCDSHSKNEEHKGVNYSTVLYFIANKLEVTFDVIGLTFFRSFFYMACSNFQIRMNSMQLKLLTWSLSAAYNTEGAVISYSSWIYHKQEIFREKSIKWED